MHILGINTVCGNFGGVCVCLYTDETYFLWVSVKQTVSLSEN